MAAAEHTKRRNKRTAEQFPFHAAKEENNAAVPVSRDIRKKNKLFFISFVWIKFFNIFVP
jgi:hypothetical protein